MSAQRFIRCKHCRMPHEADATRCPLTGKEIVRSRRSSSMETEAVSGKPLEARRPHDEAYWKHALGPKPGSPSDPDAMRGRIVEGKYRIEELLGRGGMGVVYRAENVRLGKLVAIKILLEGYPRGSEAEQRFRREARIVGSLGHPNVVEIFDVGALEDGAPFQVMELLSGQTLSERIRLEGALPIDEVVDVGEQILSGLVAAHTRGIVHRDLKPDNVFLHRRSGVVVAKLLDFGVSKAMGSDTTLSLTVPGSIVGTPFYLAPEQARGDRGVDHRVDVWAMGVLLYEALTGALPFVADNYHALLAKILSVRPAAPRELRPQLPEALEAVVLRALAFDPRQRFGTASEMLEALRQTRGRRNRPVRPVLETVSVEVDLSDRTLTELRRTGIAAAADDATEVFDSDSFRALEPDE